MKFDVRPVASRNQMMSAYMIITPAYEAQMRANSARNGYGANQYSYYSAPKAAPADPRLVALNSQITAAQQKAVATVNAAKASAYNAATSAINSALASLLAGFRF